MVKKKDDPPPKRNRASQPGKPTSARTRSIAHFPPPKGDEEVKGDVVDSEFEEVADPPEQSKEAVQAPLLPESEMKPQEPEPIQNNRVAATYLGLTLSQYKDDKFVSLAFSMKLTKEHEDHVPEKVSDAYKWVVKTDNKQVTIQGIEKQTIEVFAAPKEKKSEMKIVGGVIEKSQVVVNEETGKGTSIDVIRFKFSVKIPRTRDAIDFAAWNDELDFWLVMKDTQRRMN